MPIYEYQCENCGHEMEKIQKMSDEPLKLCPSCETESLKKLVSAAAFRLKGSGWYETDFKTGSKKNALHSSDSTKSEKPKSEGKDTKSQSTTKSDSKKSDKGTKSNSTKSA